jgi:hypothetical protein
MKGWKDITLRQSMELELIGEMDQMDLIVNQYAIINNMTIEEVERMTPEQLFIEAEKYKFLLTLPEPKEHKWIKVNDREYGFVDLKSLTLAQMVDIEEYYNGGMIENANKILSVLYLPKKKKWFGKKEIEEYVPDTQREDDILDLNMEIVWGSLLFFCLIEMRYTKGLLDYLMAQLKTADPLMKEKIQKFLEEKQ